MDTESGPVSVARPVPLVIFPNQRSVSGLLSCVHGNRGPGFYGRFEAHGLATKAAEVTSKISDANKDTLEQVLLDFFTLAKNDHEGDPNAQVAESCWLTIRTTPPSEQYILPRWHQDGCMFTCTCREPKMPHSKYAFTLLGPSTRVLLPSPGIGEVLATGPKDRKHWDFNEPDPEFIERLAGFPQASLELGQVIRFSWGQTDSPVHSEPDSTGLDRLFISILFGSEDEIRDMCRFRGDEFGDWY